MPPLSSFSFHVPSRTEKPLPLHFYIAVEAQTTQLQALTQRRCFGTNALTAQPRARQRPADIGHVLEVPTWLRRTRARGRVAIADGRKAPRRQLRPLRGRMAGNVGLLAVRVA